MNNHSPIASWLINITVHSSIIHAVQGAELKKEMAVTT